MAEAKRVAARTPCGSRFQSSAATWLRRIAAVAIAAWIVLLTTNHCGIAGETSRPGAGSDAQAPAAAGPAATAETPAADTARESAGRPFPGPWGAPPQATNKEPAEEIEAEQKQIEELIRRMEEERRKELAALKNDPAWKPSHETVRVIRPCDPDAGETLLTFCVDGQGRLLAGCYQPIEEPDESHTVLPSQRAFKAWLRILCPTVIELLRGNST